jgi:drug/metabolite transporter (DMT)-like permease
MESHSSDNSPAIWIGLAVLLIAGVIVAIGSMAMLSYNQQFQQATVSTPTTTSTPAPAPAH